MSKQFTVALIVLTVVATLCVACEFAFAQSFGRTMVYGFGSISLPTESKDQYQIQRMRFGITSSPIDGVSVHFDGDFSQSFNLKCANVTGTVMQHTKVTFGRYLTPAQYSYASAQAIQMSDWPDAQKGFTAFGTGVRAEYWNGPLAVRLANFNDGESTRIGGQISAIAVGDTVGYDQSVEMTLVGESHVGYGATINGRHSPLFNPFMGGTAYDGPKSTTDVFIGTYVQAFPKIRLYAQYDWNNDHRPTRWLTGATYTFAPDSFLRLYYDSRLEKLVPSVSFSFKINA